MISLNIPACALLKYFEEVNCKSISSALACQHGSNDPIIDGMILVTDVLNLNY